VPRGDGVRRGSRCGVDAALLLPARAHRVLPGALP
jgi:hypothetical protein